MKILKLTYNEILKQTKKIGLRVTFIFIIAFTIIFPLLYKLLNTTFSDFNNYKYEKETALSSFNKGTTYEDILSNELFQIDINCYDLAIKEKIDFNDFRSIFIDELILKETELNYINRLLNGETYENLDRAIKGLENKNAYRKFYIGINEYYGLDDVKLTEIKNTKIKEIEEYKRIIKDNDYSIVLKRDMEALKSEKLTITEAVDLDYYERKIELYEFLITENIKSGDDFRVKELNIFTESYYKKTSFYFIEEKDYKKADHGGLSYKEYLEISKFARKKSEEQMQISEYAIYEGINYEKIGARTSIENSNSLSALFILFITIIVAGGIVSFEFQTGTIRLLVIRPNKRWKILLSKFLAVISILIFMIVTIFTVSVIANGIVFGFSDYNIPHLISNGSRVIETSFILITLKEFLITLIPVFFMGVLAFILSAIFNNTAFGVGIGIFLALGSGLIMEILNMAKIPFLEYTFLPYLGYTMFLDPITLAYMSEAYGIVLTFTKANIVLLMWGIILYIVAHLTFTKKDIKN